MSSNSNFDRQKWNKESLVGVPTKALDTGISVPILYESSLLQIGYPPLETVPLIGRMMQCKPPRTTDNNQSGPALVEQPGPGQNLKRRSDDGYSTLVLRVLSTGGPIRLPIPPNRPGRRMSAAGARFCRGAGFGQVGINSSPIDIVRAMCILVAVPRPNQPWMAQNARREVISLHGLSNLPRTEAKQDA